MAVDRQISLLGRCLGGIVGLSARRPRIVLWLMVMLGCASVGVTVSELKLKASRAELLSPDPVWKEYTSVFGGESEMTVVAAASTPNPQLIRTVLDNLADRLRREPETFTAVLHRIDQSGTRSKALQYLSAEELNSAIRRADGFAPVLQQNQWDLLRLEKLSDQLRRTMDSQAGHDAAADYAERLADSLNEFMTVGADGKQVQLNTKGFRSPWPQIVDAGIEHTAEDSDLAYLMNDSRSVGMLHVRPVSADSEALDQTDAISRLRVHLRELEREYADVAPDLKLSVTGIPVLEHDELRRSGRDMLNAAMIAFALVGLLLSLGLRGLRHPTLVLITLILALSITSGVAALTIGHLNVLSICFAAIMIGLGVDFGIHFVTRYLFLRQELYELQESLVLAGNSVGTGIMTSAATTAVAFGSAALTGYPGLQELGIISAAGIIICAFLTMSFLPALIAISDEKIEVDQLPVPRDGKMWRVAVVGFPIVAIVPALAGIGALGSQAVNYHDGQLTWNVRYDSNLLRLQDASARSVQAEQTLARSDASLLYAVSITDSPEKARDLRVRLAALPTVGRVVDLSSRVPEPPGAEQKKLIQTLAARLAKLPQQPPTYKQSSPEVIGSSLDRLYKSLQKSSNLTAHHAATTLDGFLNRLAGLPADQQSAVLDAYQNMMVVSLLQDFRQVARSASLEPITLQDLPQDWRDRYQQSSGDRQLNLLRIYPKENAWEESVLSAFVR
ncbi:MAG: MMPL family transporter, partial [Planctomycetaceae bacterium]|nr:MMPL family transporter [Planctomycetaceae bacterium]